MQINLNDFVLPISLSLIGGVFAMISYFSKTMLEKVTNSIDNLTKEVSHLNEKMAVVVERTENHNSDIENINKRLGKAEERLYSLIRKEV